MKTFAAEPELICRRLSRLANTARWALGFYLVWWVISSIVSLVMQLAGTGVAGVLVMAGLFLPAIVLKGILPAALLLTAHFIVRGVKKHLKIALATNIVLISCVYLGLAGLSVYGLFSLPSVYSAQLAAGAREGWLIAFVVLGGSTAIAMAIVLAWRWYLHVVATTFLFSLGKQIV